MAVADYGRAEGLAVADAAGREVSVTSDPHGRAVFATQAGGKYTLRPHKAATVGRAP
jgi:hypothetical protein